MGATAISSYTNHPVFMRLSASGPKRILALDGGGIRGALCLGFLEKIEAELAIRFKESHPNFVLSDYYDMIGGTSTGAIIATCLAKGMKVSEVKEMYLALGTSIFSSFKKKFNYRGIWVKKIIEFIEIIFSSAHYSEEKLEDILNDDKYFKGITFGTDSFKTGLCIVTKRADTMSAWVMHNHPLGNYYDENKNLLISDLLRATSAAPSYFKPKVIKLANGEEGVFIDGGVSSYNNPALMMFYICSLSNMPYCWLTGKDKLMITSVGTGFNRDKKDSKEIAKRKIFRWASDIPDLFMADATSLNQLVLQTLGHTETPQYLNSEFKNLIGQSIVAEPLFTYQRYNVALTQYGLQGLVQKKYSSKEIDHLVEMSNGENAQTLYEIGKKSADKDIEARHFPPSFDHLYGHLHTILTQKDNATISPWIIEKGKHYKKFKPIYARIAAKVEEITSITSSGKETTNKASIGDFIVKNQTDAKEEYVIEKDKFNTRYQFHRKVDHQWTEYLPIGEIYAICLTQEILDAQSWHTHFFLMAAWSEKQYCAVNDYLVCPIDGSEFYRIDKKEFHETYKIAQK